VAKGFNEDSNDSGDESRTAESEEVADGHHMGKTNEIDDDIEDEGDADNDDDDGADNAGEVAFLSCEFESADPTSTALELSKRLSHRVGGDPSNAPEAGLMLGLLGK